MERSLRRWRLAAAALAVAVVGAYVLAAAPSQMDEIRAKMITLHDDASGNTVVISTANDASILMRSAKGNATVRLEAYEGAMLHAPSAYLTMSASPKGGAPDGAQNEVRLSADGKGGGIELSKVNGKESDLTFSAPPK